MPKYRLTNKAIDDLSDIWNYTIDMWSEKQADLYYEMLIDFCEQIAENPSMGKNYEEITTALYGFKANKHILFYRMSSDTEIEIVRILHESMDLRNRIRD